MLFFLFLHSSSIPYIVEPDISEEPIVLPTTHEISIPIFISPIDGISVEDLEKIISSDFGLRVLNRQANIHKGLDLVAKKGTKIRAAADGVVVLHYPPPDGYYKGHPEYGGLLILGHGDGAYTFYAHLSETWIGGGAEVKQGQYIGVIGDTGNAYGIHLHFEIILSPKLFFEY